MQKNLKLIFISLVLVVAYLYLAHTYIYRRIGYVHLPPTDNRHEYVISNPVSSQIIKYAAIGDSLTSGAGTDKYEDSYPYHLSQSLAGKDKTVVHTNFSYPGARTKNVVNDLLEPAIAAQPDIVTVLIGTNDVHGFVSAEEFQKNYAYILSQLASRTKARIYAISIPKIGSRTLILPPYDFYFDRRIDRFNQIIRDLAVRYKLDYIDLTTSTTKILKHDSVYYAADSFHPSNEGYADWANKIYENIRAAK